MKLETNISKELQEIRQLLTVQQDEQPINFEEACKYLGLSRGYLYKLTCLKQISYYKPNGKLIYFKKSELNKWLSRGKRKSKDEIEAEAENYLKLGVSGL